MAYDEDLANRIRELLAGEADLTERKMFGGLAYLLGGHMALAAGGEGGIMVRVDPAAAADLSRGAGVRFMEMGGRQLRGWLRIEADGLRTKRQLARWVALGTAYVRSLPPKS